MLKNMHSRLKGQLKWRNFLLEKCILSYYAHFYNSIMLCLRVITFQMFYYIISALHRNVTVGPGRCIIPGVTIAEHACSSFSIKNDNDSEIFSPVNSFRGISDYYSLPQSLYYVSLYSPCKSLSGCPF